jgi:23S rRNA pseudouridine1911/1915/1917 synthase
MGKIEILYEDNHVIAAIKPYGVLSQSDITGSPDMLTLLKEYIKEKYNKPGNVFCGLVHRLDRPTGGAMVFARTSKGASRLSESIRNGDFKKTYLCVVCGEVKKNESTLTDYLIKNQKDNQSKVVSANTAGAKKAILSYSVLGIKDGYSLLKVDLITGRHHQIRVQLNHMGYPLFGERKYSDYHGKGELALWSHEISFSHPTKKEPITITASAPFLFPFNLFNILGS